MSLRWYTAQLQGLPPRSRHEMTQELLRYLRHHGCELLREGAGHHVGVGTEIHSESVQRHRLGCKQRRIDVERHAGIERRQLGCKWADPRPPGSA